MRAVNGVVRATVIVLALVVLGGLALVVAGQFGAGPIGKQKQAVAGRGDWVTYTDPKGLFSVQLPTEPTVENTETSFGAPWQRLTSRAGLSQFEVQTVDFAEGVGGVRALNWLDEEPGFYAKSVQGRVLSTTRTDLQGQPAVEFSIEGDDGWYYRALVALYGHRTYVFIVSARSDAPEGLQRLIQTFTPLTPGQR